MEDYCEHWLPNYFICKHHEGRVFVVNHITNTAKLGHLCSSTAEALTTHIYSRFMYSSPTFTGRVLVKDQYQIIAESDVPFTQLTHPELFI